jgi:protein-tyrosine phosphatase
MKNSRMIISDGSLSAADAQTVNVREISVGKIAPKMLYRSSHPIKDYKQETVISLLASKARIAAVLNLCDTNSGIIKKAFFAPWYNRLLKSSRVLALGMDFNHTSEPFRKKLKKALQFIINTEGPWLIHCHAGVDRTGYVSIILEAFMGATLDEISNDYLLSFNSIFDSSIFDESKKADSRVVMRLLSNICDSTDITDQNLQGITEIYLKNEIGLSDVELDLLRRKLSGHRT